MRENDNPISGCRSFRLCRANEWSDDPLLMGLIGRVNGRLGGVETITVRGGGDSEVKIGTKPQSLRTQTSQSLLMGVKTGLHSHGLG
jgi:hypothetical protein